MSYYNPHGFQQEQSRTTGDVNPASTATASVGSRHNNRTECTNSANNLIYLTNTTVTTPVTVSSPIQPVPFVTPAQMYDNQLRHQPHVQPAQQIYQPLQLQQGSGNPVPSGNTVAALIPEGYVPPNYSPNIYPQLVRAPAVYPIGPNLNQIHQPSNLHYGVAPAPTNLFTMGSVGGGFVPGAAVVPVPESVLPPQKPEAVLSSVENFAKSEILANTPTSTMNVGLAATTGNSSCAAQALKEKLPSTAATAVKKGRFVVHVNRTTSEEGNAPSFVPVSTRSKPNSFEEDSGNNTISLDALTTASITTSTATICVASTANTVTATTTTNTASAATSNTALSKPLNPPISRFRKSKIDATWEPWSLAPPLHPLPPPSLRFNKEGGGREYVPLYPQPAGPGAVSNVLIRDMKHKTKPPDLTDPRELLKSMEKHMKGFRICPLCINHTLVLEPCVCKYKKPSAAANTLRWVDGERRPLDQVASSAGGVTSTSITGHPPLQEDQQQRSSTVAEIPNNSGNGTSSQTGSSTSGGSVRGSAKGVSNGGKYDLTDAEHIATPGETRDCSPHEVSGACSPHENRPPPPSPILFTDGIPLFVRGGPSQQQMDSAANDASDEREYGTAYTNEVFQPREEKADQTGMTVDTKADSQAAVRPELSESSQFQQQPLMVMMMPVNSNSTPPGFHQISPEQQPLQYFPLQSVEGVTPNSGLQQNTLPPKYSQFADNLTSSSSGGVAGTVSTGDQVEQHVQEPAEIKTPSSVASSTGVSMMANLREDDVAIPQPEQICPRHYGSPIRTPIPSSQNAVQSTLGSSSSMLSSAQIPVEVVPDTLLRRMTNCPPVSRQVHRLVVNRLNMPAEEKLFDVQIERLLEQWNQTYSEMLRYERTSYALLEDQLRFLSVCRQEYANLLSMLEPHCPADVLLAVRDRFRDLSTETSVVATLGAQLHNSVQVQQDQGGISLVRQDFPYVATNPQHNQEGPSDFMAGGASANIAAPQWPVSAPAGSRNQPGRPERTPIRNVGLTDGPSTTPLNHLTTEMIRLSDPSAYQQHLLQHQQLLLHQSRPANIHHTRHLVQEAPTAQGPFTGPVVAALNQMDYYSHLQHHLHSNAHSYPNNTARSGPSYAELAQPEQHSTAPNQSVRQSETRIQTTPNTDMESNRTNGHS